MQIQTTRKLLTIASVMLFSVACARAKDTTVGDTSGNTPKQLERYRLAISGDGRIFVVNATGSDLRRLDKKPEPRADANLFGNTTSSSATEPHWSQDGKSISFKVLWRAPQKSEVTLFRVNSDGSDLKSTSPAKALPEPTLHHSEKKLSPDGKVTAVIDYGKNGVRLLNSQSELIKVALPNKRCAFVHWSPDSKAFLLVTENKNVEGAFPLTLYGALIYDIATGAQTQIVSDANCNPDTSTDSFVDWSPQGEAVCILATVPPDSESSYYIVNKSGDRKIKLTDCPKDYVPCAPRWSTDGKFIAVAKMYADPKFPDRSQLLSEIDIFDDKGRRIHVLKWPGVVWSIYDMEWQPI